MWWVVVGVCVVVVLSGVRAAIKVDAVHDPASVVLLQGSDPESTSDSGFPVNELVTSDITDDDDGTGYNTSTTTLVTYTFFDNGGGDQTASVLDHNDGLTFTANLDGNARKVELALDESVTNGSVVKLRVLTDNPGFPLFLANETGSKIYGRVEPTATFDTYQVTLVNLTEDGAGTIWMWSQSGSGADEVTFDWIEVTNSVNHSALAAKWELGYVEGNEYVLRVRVLDMPANREMTVLAYENDDTIDGSALQVSVNVSEGTDWTEVDVTSLARQEFQNGLGVLKFRYYIDRGGNITETELVVGVTQDLNFLPQGPGEVQVGSRVKNEWQLLSSVPGIEINNIMCSFEALGAGNVSVRSLNDSYLGVVYPNLPLEANSFGVWWTANSSVVNEGENVQILCNLTVDTVNVTRVSQFVYVNRDVSFWEYIQDILANVLEVLGIVRDNQVYINQTRDIANETLGLVQGLEGSVRVVPQSVEVFAGQEITAMSVVTVGSDAEDNATCTMTVYYPNATKWLDVQGMNATGEDGVYTTQVVFGEVTGNFQAIARCSGGGLAAPVRGVATWKVFDGVRMSSIT